MSTKSDLRYAIAYHISFSKTSVNALCHSVGKISMTFQDASCAIKAVKDLTGLDSLPFVFFQGYDTDSDNIGRSTLVFGGDEAFLSSATAYAKKENISFSLS